MLMLVFLLVCVCLSDALSTRATEDAVIAYPGEVVSSNGNEDPVVYEAKVMSPSQMTSGVAAQVQIALTKNGSPLPADEEKYIVELTVKSKTPDCELASESLNTTSIHKSQVSFPSIVLNIMNTSQLVLCPLEVRIIDCVTPDPQAKLVATCDVNIQIVNPHINDVKMDLQIVTPFEAGKVGSLKVTVSDNEVVLYYPSMLFVSLEIDKSEYNLCALSGETSVHLNDECTAEFTNLLIFTRDNSITECPLQITLHSDHDPSLQVQSREKVTIVQGKIPLDSVRLNVRQPEKIVANSPTSFVVEVLAAGKPLVDPSKYVVAIHMDPSSDSGDGCAIMNSVAVQPFVLDSNSVSVVGPLVISSNKPTKTCHVYFSLMDVQQPDHAKPISNHDATLPLMNVEELENSMYEIQFPKDLVMKVDEATDIALTVTMNPLIMGDGASIKVTGNDASLCIVSSEVSIVPITSDGHCVVPKLKIQFPPKVQSNLITCPLLLQMMDSRNAITFEKIHYVYISSDGNKIELSTSNKSAIVFGVLLIIIIVSLLGFVIWRYTRRSSSYLSVNNEQSSKSKWATV